LTVNENAGIPVSESYRIMMGYEYKENSRKYTS
jgi:hypothetical protein